MQSARHHLSGFLPRFRSFRAHGVKKNDLEAIPLTEICDGAKVPFAN
jgi:hypothetical protein